MNPTLQKQLFGFTSALTEMAPLEGARILDGTVRPLIGHPALRSAFDQRNLLTLRRAGALRRVLILSDIHLGDAVMLQGLPAAVKTFFPDAETHYVVSQAAAPFVTGHPDISHLHPLYTGSPLPSPEDHSNVKRLLQENTFDLVVNACPFFAHGHPLPAHGVLDFLTHAPRLVDNEYHPTEPNHFIYQSHRFLVSLLGRLHSPRRATFLRGARLFLDEKAVQEAGRFLEALSPGRTEPLVLFNPDTASPFTKPPEAFCTSLLLQLTAHGGRVLVAEGHTDRGIGRRLIESLPFPLRGQAALIPSTLSATAFAALIDRVDLFISGDTGPLHWAAARKEPRGGGHAFGNRTSVIGLFGATPSHMSGYDSSDVGYLPAWQNAPSRTFVSAPTCRNLTCLNKLYKTCKKPRCFEGLQSAVVSRAVLQILSDSTSRNGIPEQTMAV